MYQTISLTVSTGSFDTDSIRKLAVIHLIEVCSPNYILDRMSYTSTFLLNPSMNTQEDNTRSDKKYYRSGVRGNRVLLGICFIFIMYVIVIGNLITLVLVSSLLRLNSQGSIHFSFVADNALRFHSSLYAEKALVEGLIMSSPSLSISSPSDLQLRAGVLLSDEAGVLSQTSVLSMSENSISTHKLTNHIILHAPYQNQDTIFLAGDVRINLSIQAEELSADSGFETAVIENRESLMIQGDSDVTLQGGRGVSISTQTTLIGAPNSTLSLQADNINITSSDSLLLITKELTNDDVISLQLRLCACKDGALFLLRHGSDSCRVRGSLQNLC